MGRDGKVTALCFLGGLDRVHVGTATAVCYAFRMWGKYDNAMAERASEICWRERAIAHPTGPEACGGMLCACLSRCALSSVVSVSTGECGIALCPAVKLFMDL